MAKKGAMDELVWDALQTSDAPTPAESGHASTYCYHADITTAESALAVDEYSSFKYHVTASDFSHLHKQEMTLTFWHKHTITGTCCVVFENNAGDRYYPATYTQSVSDTWEKATITLTGDTSGTWLHAGTGIGMLIAFVLASGSNYHGTANTWQAGFKSGVSGMANHASSASNNFKITQVGLYLGSTAPTFTSPLIATVKDQVDYYIQRYDYNTVAAEVICPGGVSDSTSGYVSVFVYRKEFATLPVVTSSAGTTFAGREGGSTITFTGISFIRIGRHAAAIIGASSSGWVANEPGEFQRNLSNTTFLQFDARH